MSPRKPGQKRGNRSRRGTSVEAPSEFGFVTGDTPRPGDVSGRADEPGDASTRLSSVLSALKLSFGVVLVLSTSAAIAWGAHRFALTTPRFAISECAVDGNRRISDEKVARTAGIEKGQNIFSADLEEAEKRLLSDPWIKSAKITRSLPGTVRIELAERDARAIASIEGELYLVTPAGEPFKKLGEGDPHDLTVISGVSLRGVALDRAREIERIRSALEVLRHYETLPVAAVHPAQEVHLGADGGMVMTIGTPAVTLQLGRKSYRQKLLMAARVLGRLGKRGERPGIIFLDNEAHEERVVVRMR